MTRIPFFGYVVFFVCFWGLFGFGFVVLVVFLVLVGFFCIFLFCFVFGGMGFLYLVFAIILKFTIFWPLKKLRGSCARLLKLYTIQMLKGMKKKKAQIFASPSSLYCCDTDNISAPCWVDISYVNRCSWREKEVLNSWLILLHFCLKWQFWV